MQAGAHAPAGAHAARQVDGADEGLAQAALQLHARDELGDVQRARLVAVELAQRCSSASEAPPVATMLLPASGSDGAIAET